MLDHEPDPRGVLPERLRARQPSYPQTALSTSRAPRALTKDDGLKVLKVVQGESSGAEVIHRPTCLANTGIQAFSDPPFGTEMSHCGTEMSHFGTEMSHCGTEMSHPWRVWYRNVPLWRVCRGILQAKYPQVWHTSDKCVSVKC